MSTRSISAGAVTRSHRAERIITFGTGLMTVLVGSAVLALSYGVFGTGRAQRPLLDPIAVERIAARPELARILAIAGGTLALAFGLWWTARSVRPEPRPGIELDGAGVASLLVTSNAIARAVQADTELLDGVTKARVRSVGDQDNPALRLTVWLREGSDLKEVWQELNERVLARARQSLEREILPTAIRLELGVAERARVQ